MKPRRKKPKVEVHSVVDAREFPPITMRTGSNNRSGSIPVSYSIASTYTPTRGACVVLTINPTSGTVGMFGHRKRVEIDFPSSRLVELIERLLNGSTHAHLLGLKAKS